VHLNILIWVGFECSQLFLIAGLCSAIATDINIRVDQKSDNIPVELSSNCISKDVQSGNCNYFSSSEFTEPERMRFAVSENTILSNYLGQQTTEKGVTESDGSVDRISNLSGQKRRLLDITPDLQNGISPKMSGIPRKKRNNDYIPNDDDLLASILGINYIIFLLILLISHVMFCGNQSLFYSFNGLITPIHLLLFD